jgi:hypothetical protein
MSGADMGTVRMARVNLIVDKASVGKLRKLLGTHSDSETVRAAVEHRLASLQALNALRRLQEIGKLEDVFSRNVRTKG